MGRKAGDWNVYKTYWGPFPERFDVNWWGKDPSYCRPLYRIMTCCVLTYNDLWHSYALIPGRWRVAAYRAEFTPKGTTRNILIRLEDPQPASPPPPTPTWPPFLFCPRLDLGDSIASSVRLLLYMCPIIYSTNVADHTCWLYPTSSFKVTASMQPTGLAVV